MAKEKSNVMGYLHWVIGVALMLLGYVIPASEPLTPMGVKVLMIFVGMIYLWCTVNAIGGSFIALFMVSVIGYAPLSKVLAAGVSESNWLVVFFSCILFMSAIESGMPRYVSHAIFKASQNVVTGRPMALLFIVMCAAFVLSALTSMIPAVLMFWGICYALIDDLKLEKRDGYSMLLVLGSFLGAMLGYAALPFKGATLIIISAFEKASEQSIPYGPYIIINLICSVLIMAVFLVAVKYIFRMDLSKVANIDGKLLTKEKLPPMSVSVKAHLVTVLAFILLVMAASFLPTDAGIGAFLANLGSEGIAFVMLIVLFVVKDNDKPCIKIGKTMGSMPWPAIFMVMTAVYMASVLKDTEVTGVIPWLKQVMNPILGGHSEFIFAALIFLIALVLTCFFHNGALGNMLMPVLFVVADANGYNGVAIAAMMTLAINMAFLAPSASNYAPLLHGNKEYVSLKDIWTYGLFFELLTFAAFLFLGLPLAKFMM